jgi:hypothetical protein
MNSEKLLVLDSRDRDDITNEDRKKIRLTFPHGINFRKISLVFMDFPIDASEDDEEALFYITIDELPINVQGTNYADRASFVQVRTSDSGGRSLAFQESSFSQTIDLGSVQTFTEFNITIRYRLKTTETLIINSDYSAIFKISD